jgi:Ca2+ transporting ATPase
MRRAPRGRSEPLVGGWLFFRYMVIGAYVGVATVFGYAWWFMFYSFGPKISFYQLVLSIINDSNTQTHFHHCNQDFPEVGCAMFTNYMSRSASTMSLSILVVIEMLNACNALSQSESLITLPVWKNMKLIYAIVLSMVLHFAVLYIPFLQTLFQVSPLNLNEWKAVLWISAPVLYVSELNITDVQYYRRGFETN